MPFGSALARLKTVDLRSAEGARIRFDNTPLTSLGLRALGVPHIGLQLRARKILSRLLPRPRRVLDAGCGNGIYSFTLAPGAGRVDGIDSDAARIRHVASVNLFPNLHFRTGDICRLPYPPASFDLIICSDVLEHIPDDQAAFAQLSRALQKGGTLLVTVPALTDKMRRIYRRFGHARPGYTGEQMEALCQKNGLRMVRHEQYSYPIAESFSDINYALLRHPLALGLVYPGLYLGALLGDILLPVGVAQGHFFEITK